MVELAKLMKGRYKITFDESYHYERPEVRQADRRWYEMIPLTCGGNISLYQEEPTVLLKLYTPKQRKTITALFERFREVSGVSLDMHFSGYETELIFPPELLMEVCKAAGAKKKYRKRTQEEKIRLAEAGRDFHFKGKNNGEKTSQKAQNEIF